MGPSGSGKTTLLNVLSGRQKTSGKDSSQGKAQRVKFSGQVTLSGESMKPTDYHHRVSYVYQDSALPISETPRECIDFSAYLRLPARVTDAERKDFVDRMLESLHLENCADVIVGSALQKGISGGQQKRVAVGVELISNPKLLFLDEPLSGLDSYNATELVNTLKDLAQSGVPVLMTLHQPSSAIFAQLDDLIVLHRGEVCYHGSIKRLRFHFRSLGFDFPPNSNPADQVVTLIQKENDETVRSIKDRWLQSETYRSMANRIETPVTTEEEHNRHSSSDSSEEEEQACIRDKPAENRKGGFAPLLALLKRDARGVKRQWPLFVTQFVVFKLVIAVLYGFFFFHQGSAGDDPDSGPNCLAEDFSTDNCLNDFKNHFAALSLISMTAVIDSMTLPVMVFHGERSTFLRECAGGYYNVASYYLSKTVYEAMIILVECIVLVLGTYWLVGFRSNPVELVLGMWLMAETSASLMWSMATVATNREQATALSMGPWILQFAFSGLLLPIKQIPAWVRWLRWVCPLYYGLGFISTTEFHFLYASDPFNSTIEANWTLAKLEKARPEDHAELAGNYMRRAILASNEVNYSSRWWPYFGMCCVLIVGYRILATFTMWKNSRFVV
uniref:ABC transporter domain-containing protein n=1 Tax=Alexandrium catenella TaxID=2925 RepID=A0A7S1LJ00_ALECA